MDYRKKNFKSRSLRVIVKTFWNYFIYRDHSDNKKHYLKLHDFNDINKAIEIYVDYFNHHRVAYRLDYMTPVEYRMIKGFN